MAATVPPLVDPLPAEMAVTVASQLAPFAYFEEDGSSSAPPVAGGGRPKRPKLDDEFAAQYFQAPVGAIVFSDLKPGEATFRSSAISVAFVPVVETTGLPAQRFTDAKLQVLGVVASPVEDPGLVSRHATELAHLAVYVTGAHTILANPDDCKTLFPMQYIGIDTTKQWTKTTPTSDTPFYVARLKQVNKEDAFAMVLQVGTAELRIILLGQRFSG